MRHFVDHTGEVYENRQITGPGTFLQKPNGRSVWSWKWVCLDCGTRGESMALNSLRRHRHVCPDRYAEMYTPHRVGRTPGHNTDLPSRRTPPPAPQPPKERGWICARQCRTCGHYRDWICNYLLDTGCVRPKVKDLRTDPCPVRDPDYKTRGKEELY